MIYIPMLKMRTEELKVIKKMKDYFSDNIIPLIEILNDMYEPRYKIDPITSEFIYREVGKSRRRVTEIPNESDIITLEFLNELVEGKPLFIDYFRFTRKKYGNQIDINKVELAWKLNNNEELYKNKIRDISKFSNMIPVISIKKEYGMKKNDLKNFLIEMQEKNYSIALRITEEWLDEYDEVIKDVLTSRDYLLFDIEEQSPETKFMELEELIEKDYNADIVLLNSPRKLSIKNGDYPAHGVTDLIDNSARDKMYEYNLDGYGDYCSHKDTLPMRGGSCIGAALALLYDYNENVFYSYVNKDITLGMRGYLTLIPTILAEKTILDPDNECIAFKEIEKLESSGNWATWINVCMTRYIHQIYKSMKYN